MRGRGKSQNQPLARETTRPNYEAYEGENSNTPTTPHEAAVFITDRVLTPGKSHNYLVLFAYLSFSCVHAAASSPLATVPRNCALDFTAVAGEATQPATKLRKPIFNVAPASTAKPLFFGDSPTKPAVLFVDTPVLGPDRQPLNTPGKLPVVIDHHGPYAPQNPLSNSGAQVLTRLQSAAQNNRRDGAIDVEAALKDFHRGLFGNDGLDGTRHLLATDNLADAAEVIAILRDDTLKRAILADPRLATMLTEAGQYTDFHLFLGDAYEKNNPSPQSQKAIAVSKAILGSHSELLRKFGIPGGDRIDTSGLSEKQQQQLIAQAASRSRDILLAAVKSGPEEIPVTIQVRAQQFDAGRGGPGTKPRADGKPTSYDAAVKSHEDFNSQLRPALMGSLQRTERMSEDMAQESVEPLLAAYERNIFGHGAYSTGNQFADWAASPMANAYQSSGPRPLKLEVAGRAEDVGQRVILAKSSARAVNLQTVAEALNTANEAKKDQLRLALLGRAVPAAEVNAQMERFTGFVSRGTDLVFNFGGHALSRAEVQLIIARTLAREEAQIVPPARAP